MSGPSASSFQSLELMWLCGVPRTIPKCQHTSQPYQGPGAQCHSLWGTPGPAGWKWWYYPQPCGCDVGLGCSLAVHKPSSWALLESTYHLWWSPQPQLFCSQSEIFIFWIIWDRDRGGQLLRLINDLFSTTWLKVELVHLAGNPFSLTSSHR